MRNCILPAVVLTTGLGLLLPDAATAQEIRADAELTKICAGELVTFALPPFGIFDTDQDLLISDDEAARCDALELMFSRLDLDASESLSRPEYDGFAELWRRRVLTFGGKPESAR